MAQSNLVKPYSIKNYGLPYVLTVHMKVIRALRKYGKFEFTTHSYLDNALNTIAWFMYGEKL